MEKEITLKDVADYLDNIGIQFLATIGLNGKPKVRPMQYMMLENALYRDMRDNPIFKVFYLRNIDGWMTNLGHVKGLEDRNDFAKPIHFAF